MKALGITAMILAIVFIFIPFGAMLTVIASIMAALAAGPGLTFGVVAILVGLINTLFLSPSIWLAQAGAQESGAIGPGVVLILVHIICGVILFFWNKKKRATA